MERTRLFVVLGLFAVLGLTAAIAEEAPPFTHVELPREGLSIDVPEGWQVDLYGEAVLELTNGEARLWIRTYDGSADRQAERAWTEIEGGGMRATGLVARDEKAVFEVEVALPAGQETLKAQVDAALDSIDATPYENDTRHVDWTNGWTMDLPAGWTRVVSPRHVARFEGPKGRAQIEVDDTYSASGEDADAAFTAAWREVLERLEKERGVVPVGKPLVETQQAVGGKEAKRVHLGLNVGEDGSPTAWLIVLLAEPYRVALFVPADPKEAFADSVRTLQLFRLGTHPGPRAGEAGADEPTDAFAAGGPPVRFTLPEGWEMRNGSNSMRLAEWDLPGAEKVAGIVFYFGDGGGGPIDDNLSRWKRQMGAQVEAKTEQTDIAEGVKAHWLDAIGSYSPGMGAGNPHAGTHGGFRMLAVVLEVPQGPLFVKVVGPTAAIDAQAEDFRTWIQSFRVAQD